MRELQMKVNLVKAIPLTGEEISYPTTMIDYRDPVDYLGSGLEATVHRVWIHDKPYAYKKMDSESRIEHAFSVWQILRQQKVPTPITYRMVEEAGKLTGLLMTDLTQDWKRILISTNRTKLDVLRQVSVVNPQLVQQFRDYDLDDPSHISDFNQQIEKIADQTARGKIFFDKKDMTSATFDSQGKLKIVISDLGSVQPNSNIDYAILRNSNSLRMKRFIDHLKDAQYFAGMV